MSLMEMVPARIEIPKGKPACNWDNQTRMFKDFQDEDIQPTDIIALGNTWKRGEDGKFILPKFSLGKYVIAWMVRWLRSKDDRSLPYMPTREQARFLMWMYAIDEEGNWLFNSLALQRIKGWGKSPFAAAICAVEAVGPCRFDGWNEDGTPRAKRQTNAWVQIAATSKEQTRFTMQCFPWLLSDECIEKYRIDVQKEIIYFLDEESRIEAVTSNPKGLQGGQVTFVLGDETQHWVPSNSGDEAYETIANNATKASGGNGRDLTITNAYNPNEYSVAQTIRETWEDVQRGVLMDGKQYYDSLEAADNAPIGAKHLDEMYHILSAVRGDSVWQNVDKMVDKILRTKRESDSRRFWYNSIVSSDKQWVARDKWKACLREDIVVGPDEEVVMFFDGSKSDDATALVMARVSDGAIFYCDIWEADITDPTWRVNQGEVSSVIDGLFSSYNIVSFKADPGYGKSDVKAEMWWDRSIDEWHQKYQSRLKYWAVPTGNQPHSIRWDMNHPVNARRFIAETMKTRSDIEAKVLIHTGMTDLTYHVMNAYKNYNNQYDGEGISKRKRGSRYKIDGAVCMIGTQMMVREIKNAKKKVEEEKPQSYLWMDEHEDY